MFKHLLVPLDGSQAAEAALPAAGYLAGKLGAAVTLLHVVEQEAPRRAHGEPHLGSADEAQAYLDQVAARAFPVGVPVERHVHAGPARDVARSIVGHEGELGYDLVVMCIHGPRGLRRWLFGALAQQIVARGTIPVLIVPPALGDGFVLRRILVALDGRPEHEAGLIAAEGLARACGAGLHLELVVPTGRSLAGKQRAAGTFLPGAASAMLELAHDEAEATLGAHAQRLQAAGLSATVAVARGDPTAAIERAAQVAAADLVVVARHGVAGLDDSWSGSVPPRVIALADRAMLLVPLRG